MDATTATIALRSSAAIVRSQDEGASLPVGHPVMHPQCAPVHQVPSPRSRPRRAATSDRRRRSRTRSGFGRSCCYFPPQEISDADADGDRDQQPPSRVRPPRGRAAQGGLKPIQREPQDSSSNPLFFGSFAPYIGSAGSPAMEINGRRNKPFGPGGGTRRLHQSPPSGELEAGLWRGRNRIDEGVKGVLFPGIVPPLSGYCNSCQRQLCSGCSGCVTQFERPL
ncbi:hypothetical protein AB7M16_002121 [Bradyrhizobium sp. USDA 372]